MKNLNFCLGFLLFGFILFFPQNGYAEDKWYKGYFLEVSMMATTWQNTGCQPLRWRYKNDLNFFTDCERKGHIYFCKKTKIKPLDSKLFWFSSEEDCENAISLLKEHDKMTKKK